MAKSQSTLPELTGGNVAILTDPSGVEASINAMGEEFGLIDVEKINEIDESTDLPPGVSQVKMIDGKPIVFWQLAREGYDGNRRKQFCRPILRGNPHFKHLGDTQFNAFGQLCNGDLIVCYTSEELARAYHVKRREPVDLRNSFMYEPGVKAKEAGDRIDGDTVSGAFMQSVSVDSDKSIHQRAMGR